MSAVTAEAVKTLRERTGAGMMECKKALVEANGDLDAAAEAMRKSGLAKADKKASRIAAEGVIAIERSADGKTAAIVEVNCETDFVAREAQFSGFAAEVAKLALTHKPATLDELNALNASSGTVDGVRRALIAKIGENIGVRRFAVVTGAAVVGTYLHGTRIGALVAMQAGDDSVAKDIAMHVAASNPPYLTVNDVPAAEVAKEKEIQLAQMQLDPKNANKPADMLSKIIDGKLRKWTGEITLLGQPFVKDDKQSVEAYVKKAGGAVTSFVRYEVGSGIEKPPEDFEKEVAKLARGG
ncbi:MAG TPA: translation elongation factor Ts [Steroidobacteraceae bacterium]|nr:translation elongation factor Ts [Steroidobacteraceae bacterium]